MNLNVIRQMPTIFQQSSMYYGYDYHHDPKNRLEVCLEYNLYGDAQYLLSYKLKEDKGVYLLVITEHMTTAGVDSRGSEPVCEVAGRSEEEAIDYMVKKILEKPARNTCMKVDIEELEQNLRASLLLRVA